MASSLAVFSLPPASLLTLLSGLESTSVATLPAPSLAALISARFTKDVPWKSALTVKTTSTEVVAPAAKLEMVVVGVLPADQMALSAATKLMPAGT